MTMHITKDSLMDEISKIRDAFILEAEYTEEELKRLNAPEESAPVVAKTAGQEEDAAQDLLTEQEGHVEEMKPEAAPKHKTATIVRISLGVALAAAAILLFVFFWNPKHSDVISTIESTEETPTEGGTNEEATTAVSTTEAPKNEGKSVPIDEEHFPDERFRVSVMNAFDADKNEILDEKELAEAKELKVEHMWQTVDHVGRGSQGEVTSMALGYARIPSYSLKGIEYLTNLERLDCAGHYLKELDLRQNHALTYLNCAHNVLKKLDLSQNTALTEVYCEGNELEKLNVSGLAKLWTLSCGANRLTHLDLSGCTELRELHCDLNDLSELDVSQSTRLKELSLSGSDLTALDLSKNSKLERLALDGSVKLTELDLSNNPKLARLVLVNVGVKELDLSQHAQLTGVHLECADLKKLDFGASPMLYLNLSCPKLQEIDLSGFPDLESITIAKSALTALDVSQNTKLTFLVCNLGQLATLDVSHNPELEALICEHNRLTELDIANNPKLQSLDCGYNLLTELDVSQNPALGSLQCMGNDLSALNIEACSQLTSVVANLGTTIHGVREDTKIVRYSGEVSPEEADSDFIHLEDGIYHYGYNYTEGFVSLPQGINATKVQFDSGIDIDYLARAVGVNPSPILENDAMIIEGPCYFTPNDDEAPIIGCDRALTKIRISPTVSWRVNGNIVTLDKLIENLDEGVNLHLVVENGVLTVINCMYPPTNNPIKDGGHVIY